MPRKTPPAAADSDLQALLAQHKATFGGRRPPATREPPAHALVGAALRAATGSWPTGAFLELSAYASVLEHRKYVDFLFARWNDVPDEEQPLVADLFKTAQILFVHNTNAQVGDHGVSAIVLRIQLGAGKQRVSLVQSSTYNNESQDAFHSFWLLPVDAEGTTPAYAYKQKVFSWREKPSFAPLATVLFKTIHSPSLPVAKKLSLATQCRFLMRLVIPWLRWGASHESAGSSATDVDAFFALADAIEQGKLDAARLEELHDNSERPFDV